MNKKLIDNIVWFIPFKKLRSSVREYLDIIIDKRETLSNKKNKTLQCDINYKINVKDKEIFLPFREDLNNDSNFLDKYLKLVSNLDLNSVNIVDNIIFDKIMNYKNIDDDIYISGNEAIEISTIMSNVNNRIRILGKDKYMFLKYLLPINYFEISIFYERYGMDKIVNLDFVKDKNIIDVGAFVGDSSLILSEYTDKKVYAFEPMKINYDLMLKTIELNKKSNIIPVNVGLGNTKETIYSYTNLWASAGNSLIKKGIKSKDTQSEEMSIIKLDDFVIENDIEVGLIKTDIEGFEQYFLEGAKNTIKKYKPVLLINIYHNYSDFFNIKPLIESWDLGYTFKISKSRQDTAIVETLLIAEVLP